MGRPDSSTATSTTSASVTFTFSPLPPPQRSASTLTRTVMAAYEGFLFGLGLILGLTRRVR